MHSFLVWKFAENFLGHAPEVEIVYMVRSKDGETLKQFLDVC